MPIYEYECQNQHRFEIWQSMKDDALTECPTCGSSVRKIFHPAGIIFKGSGWYITDSRKGAESGDAGSTKPTADKAGEAKSEPKAATSKGAESTGGSTNQAKSEAKGDAKS